MAQHVRAVMDADNNITDKKEKGLVLNISLELTILKQNSNIR